MGDGHALWSTRGAGSKDDVGDLVRPRSLQNWRWIGFFGFFEKFTDADDWSLGTEDFREIVLGNDERRVGVFQTVGNSSGRRLGIDRF